MNPSKPCSMLVTLESLRRVSELSRNKLLALEDEQASLLLELGNIKVERGRAKEKEDAQHTVVELKQLEAKEAELASEINEKAAGVERLKALEEKLTAIQGERDARAKEKEDAQHTVVGLKQQLEAKGELASEKNEKLPVLSAKSSRGKAHCNTRRARAREKEKEHAQHTVAELTQQLEPRGRLARKTKAARAELERALEESSLQYNENEMPTKEKTKHGCRAKAAARGKGAAGLREKREGCRG